MPSRKNNAGRQGLPAATSSDTQNFCIPLPTDKEFRAAFFGALLRLANASVWDMESTGKRFEVAAWWENYVASIWAVMFECGNKQNCVEFGPQSSHITYFPCSPFGGDCELPAGYAHPPFSYISNDNIVNFIIRWGTGYELGDVFTDLLHLPSGEPFNLIPSYEYFPRIEVSGFSGVGKVKINLLTILQGGRAFIVVDGVIDLLNLKLIELEHDITSFPPETVVPLVYEFDIDTDIEHVIQIVFLPTVDDAGFPIFFGGGFRKVELCGFQFAGGEQLTEYCCDETNALLGRNNELLNKIYNLLGDGFQVLPLSSLGLGDTLPLGCSPTNFDSDPNDTGDDIQKRIDVLCYVVNYYVVMVLMAAADTAGIPVNLFLSGLADIPLALYKLKAQTTTVQALVAIITDAFGENLFVNQIICEMLSVLQGQMNSFAAFAKSVEPSEDVNPLVSALRNMVYRANQNKDNFTLFNTALEQAMKMDISSFTCPCGEGAPPAASDCGDISLVPLTGNTTQIAYLGNCVWSFTQTSVNENGRRYFSLKDVNGKQLKLSFAPAPYEHINMGGCTVNYDCGKPSYYGDNYGGGCVPDDNVLEVSWWGGSSSPATVYIKVEVGTACP